MSSGAGIGSRIKERRRQQGITLRDLANRTELTASFISQVERGKANASIDSLRRIAEALNVSMLFFLADAHSAHEEPQTPDTSTPTHPPRQSEDPLNVSNGILDYSPVQRARSRPQLTFPDSGVTYELLTPDLAHKMEAICGRLSAGVDNVARPLREPTEEWIYVLSGSLLVALDSKVYVLNPGDTIYFEGHMLRRLSCASAEDAVWISVITPPVF